MNCGTYDTVSDIIQEINLVYFPNTWPLTYYKSHSGEKGVSFMT